MVRILDSINKWLESVFVGPHGYTVYADGRMHRGMLPAAADANVALGSFRKVFGADAELDGAKFFVPSNPGTHSGLVGVFKIIDGNLAATAEFVWNRAGLKASLTWVWFCIVSVFLDLLSGVISIVQGSLSGDRVVVLSFTLLTLVLLMFLPRVIAEVKEKILYETRQPVIAKLSALVQHEARPEWV